MNRDLMEKAITSFYLYFISHKMGANLSLSTYISWTSRFSTILNPWYGNLGGRVWRPRTTHGQHYNYNVEPA